MPFNLGSPADLERPRPLLKRSQTQTRTACAPFPLVRIFSKFPQMRREIVSQSLDGSHFCLNTRKGNSYVTRSGTFHAVKSLGTGLRSPLFPAVLLLTLGKDRLGRGEGGRGTALAAVGSDDVFPSCTFRGLNSNRRMCRCQHKSLKVEFC